METLLGALKIMLLLAGIVAGIVVILTGVAAAGWIILKSADYWGQWMDEHPETEKKKHG